MHVCAHVTAVGAHTSPDVDMMEAFTDCGVLLKHKLCSVLFTGDSGYGRQQGCQGQTKQMS